MFKLILILTFLQAQTINEAQAARILGIFPTPLISNQIIFQVIWKELSLRGHEITVITPNPLNNPELINLTEIDLGFTYEILRNITIETPPHNHPSAIDFIKFAYKGFSTIGSNQLAYSEVQTLIRNESKNFDLILVHILQPTIYGLSARFGCPMVGLSTTPTWVIWDDAVNNPSNPVLNPAIILTFIDTSGIFERIYSVCFVAWIRFYYHYYVLPNSDKEVKKYIGESLPYLRDIEKNISLVMANENSVIYSARPNVPALSSLNNIHIKKKKPLPEDLQQELDNAKEGVIYFSFGSNLKIAELAKSLRQTIIESLSELPYKVLWKWESDQLPGQPKNVITRKWLPQQDILGHPNVKAFFTQGGLQSLEEAIFNAVPLIVMPFLYDQKSNALRIVRLGIGQAVDSKTVTKEELKAIISEVAENPKYRKKVQEISTLMQDVPMTGLETAIWWIEYVIRHNGVPHLRSSATYLPWYRYLLLDVIGFILGAIFISIVITHKVISLSLKIGRKAYNQLFISFS